MEQTAGSTSGSQQGADNLHRKKPCSSNAAFGANNSPILDAMNITLDKQPTIIALFKAKRWLFGKDKDLINELIIQIGTHGGKL
jgi:hypothetical protein